MTACLLKTFPGLQMLRHGRRLGSTAWGSFPDNSSARATFPAVRGLTARGHCPPTHAGRRCSTSALVDVGAESEALSPLLWVCSFWEQEGALEGPSSPSGQLAWDLETEAFALMALSWPWGVGPL